MQPRTLTMKNFGPFIHESVDFGDFQEAGLFLISGKTGAGKTTIFDGMTFALFGETSGQLRSGKEMRSMFATPEEETCVTFCFEHQGFFYEIARSPEQEVQKKRGEGTKKQTAKVRLTIYNGQMEEQKQYTKRTEVDQFIKDLLNVDAKQFFQIILLPQGEFRNFLIASSNEKEKLLRNLFGTELYQRLNDWLRQKQKAMDQSLSKKQHQIEALVPRFQWVEEKKAFVSVQETVDDWQADIAQLVERQKKLDEAFELAKGKKKQAETALYTGQEQLKLFNEQTELTDRLTALDTQNAEMQTVKATIDRLSWVDKHVNLLHNLEESRKEHTTIDAQLVELTAALSVNKQAKDDWKTEQATMNQLQEQVVMQQKTIQQLESLLPLAKRIEQLQGEERTYQQDLAELQVQVSDYQEQQNCLEAARDLTISAEKEALQAKELQLVQFKDKVKRWEEEQQQLATIKQQAQENEQAIQNNQAALVVLEKAIAELGELFKQHQSDYAKLQIARLQLLLVDGEPCPVCGSTEHIHEETPLSEKELKASERIFEKTTQLLRAKEDEHQTMRYKQQTLQEKQKELEEQKVKSQNSCTVLHQEMEKLLNEKIANPSERLLVFCKDLDQQIDTLNQKVTEQQRIEKQLSELAEKHQVVTQEFQTLEQTLQPISLEIQTLQKQVNDQTQTELMAKIAEWQHQEATCQERLTTHQLQGSKLNEEFISLNERYQQQTKQLQTIVTKEREQEQKLQQALAAGVFDSEEAMRLACEEMATLPSLQEKWSSYNQEMTVIKSRLHDLAALIVDKQPNITDLEAQYEEAEQELAAFQTQSVQHKGILQNNRQLLEELQVLAQQSSEQLTEMTQLQQLAQTLNGDNPEKISIERYVLQSFLAEILAVANQRLNKLTRGRYQFLLADKKGSYRSSTGLEINIYDDNAGMSRRAHTLSGGESFIAALALALSLADVIQNRAGGIAIEALFIDEGFGSLDEESLEMAMEALEIIENEGRMIGIISHVRELKDRIQQQLIVQANGSGQSHIKSQVV